MRQQQKSGKPSRTIGLLPANACVWRISTDWR